MSFSLLDADVPVEGVALLGSILDAGSIGGKDILEVDIPIE